MIGIDPTQYSEPLRILFAPNTPDHPRLFSVLAGHHPGTALVDDVTNPNWCVLRSGWIGRTFIGGQIDADSVTQAIALMRQQGPVHLDKNDPYAGLFPADQIGEDARFAFSGRLTGRPSFETFFIRLPEGCRIRPVDKELVKRCLWSAELLPVFGSLKRYLEISLGFCLVKEDQILSEAHAFFWGNGFFEIGAITGEAYRGLGYAPVATAHLIRACEQRGYSTFWSCDIEHTASVSVANKVGYSDPCPYTLKVYRKLGEG